MSRPVKEYLPSSVIEWVRELGLNEDEVEYQFTAGLLERDYEAEGKSGERWMMFKPPTHYAVTAMRDGETHSQRFFAGVPGWQREDKFMAEEQTESLENLVFQALGEASMCWSERPQGVFDCANAKRIGDELVSAIRQHYSSVLTLKPAKMKNLQITGWCPVCHKAKGYSGTMVMGETNDEDAQEVPAQCMCGFWQNQAPAYTLDSYPLKP